MNHFAIPTTAKMKIIDDDSSDSDSDRDDKYEQKSKRDQIISFYFKMIMIGSNLVLDVPSDIITKYSIEKNEWQKFSQIKIVKQIIKLIDGSIPKIIALDAEMGSGKGIVITDLSNFNDIIMITIHQKNTDTTKKLEQKKFKFVEQTIKINGKKYIAYENYVSKKKVIFIHLSYRENNSDNWEKIINDKIVSNLDNPLFVVDEFHKCCTQFGLRHSCGKNVTRNDVPGDMKYYIKCHRPILDIITSKFSILIMSGTLDQVIRDEWYGRPQEITNIIWKYPEAFIPEWEYVYVDIPKIPKCDYEELKPKVEVTIISCLKGIYDVNKTFIENNTKNQIIWYLPRCDTAKIAFEILKKRYPHKKIYKYFTGETKNDTEKRDADMIILVQSGTEGYDNEEKPVNSVINLNQDKDNALHGLKNIISQREIQKAKRMRNKGMYVCSKSKENYDIQNDRSRRENRITTDIDYNNEQIIMNKIYTKCENNFKKNYKIKFNAENFEWSYTESIQKLLAILRYNACGGSIAVDFPTFISFINDKIIYNIKFKDELKKLKNFIKSNDKEIEIDYSIIDELLREIVDNRIEQFEETDLELFIKMKRKFKNLKLSIFQKKIPNGYFPANPKIKQLFNEEIIPKIAKEIYTNGKKIQFVLCDNKLNTFYTIIKILKQSNLTLLYNIQFAIVECDKQEYEYQKQEKEKSNLEGIDIIIVEDTIFEYCNNNPIDNSKITRFIYADTCGSDSGYDYHTKYLESCIPENEIVLGTFSTEPKDKISRFGKQRKRKTITYEYGNGTNMATYISLDKKLF